jgi:outer membrane protein TolC
MRHRFLVPLVLLAAAGCASLAQIGQYIILPEQRTIAYRGPSDLPPARVPDTVPPRTVSDPRPDAPEWQLTLDDAIRIALENAEVVRVLSGVVATSSGQTIYDAAITNTTIDQEQARFDPVLTDRAQGSRTNPPQVTVDPLDPNKVVFFGAPVDSFLNTFSLAKTNVLGGQWSVNWTENPTRFHFPNNFSGLSGSAGATGAGIGGTSGLGAASGTGSPSSIGTTNSTGAGSSTGSTGSTSSTGSTGSTGTVGSASSFASGGSPFALNPQDPSSVALTYTQPLLQGGGFQVNMAPIVIARLNTERSFFQYKDSVQELVRGTIEAYWSLVQARLDVWARKIQVEQSREAYERERARLKAGFADAGTVAQARVTYSQFQANLIAAEANVLTREGAMRNLLGLPAEDGRRIVPVSAPTTQRLQPQWNKLVNLAEQRRPDIIELKLIAEADQQRLLQAQNQALPKLDAFYTYRWNGLEGNMPNGEHTSSRAGDFTDWTVGINFSVPLGLRQGRALVRQQALTVARDWANVDQSVHAAIAELAVTVRDIDSAYEQYLAYRETRAAATTNLQVQLEQFRTGRAIYLNVLQALNDFGTAVSSEALAVTTYNTDLARLERQTGTILEAHGLVFYEERIRAAGPFGHKRLYPRDIFTLGSPERYPSSGEPAENAFDLRNPAPRTTALPPPRPVPPEERRP